MKYALSIITYFTKEILDRGRLDLFKKSINSLIKSNFEGPVFLVDDGSSVTNHIDYVRGLNDSRINIVLKDTNGGLSKMFNTGIRLILDEGCDYGFLANDDIVYSKDWFTPYLDAMSKTSIHHLSFFSQSWVSDSPTSTRSQDFTINGCDLVSYNWVQGGLLTFTREMIQNIGYFKIMPYKSGHEHSNFSIRAAHHQYSIGFVDIKDSHKYLRYAEDAGKITTRDSDFREQAKVNENLIGSLSYEPCIEE